MRTVRKIRFILFFYRSYFLLSLIINACCVDIFWTYGLSYFPELFWLKTTSLGITYYFINEYKKKEYYYYYNAGISKAMLWTFTLLFDFSLFLFLIMQTHTLR